MSECIYSPSIANSPFYAVTLFLPHKRDRDNIIEEKYVITQVNVITFIRKFLIPMEFQINNGY